MVSANSTSLAPHHAAALLGAMSTTLRALIDTSPAELLSWRPNSEEWCLLEVIGHLVETEERGFAGRIRTILAEERPQFTTWDPSAVSYARRDGERDPAELLAEFTTRRTMSVTLVRSLTVDDLSRGGDHPDVDFLTVNALLHEWLHHDANHLRQILANIQSYTWPHMGNARRFSEPESLPSDFG